MSQRKRGSRTLLALLVSAMLLGATGLFHGVHVSAPAPTPSTLLAGGGDPIPPGPG